MQEACTIRVLCRKKWRCIIKSIKIATTRHTGMRKCQTAKKKGRGRTKEKGESPIQARAISIFQVQKEPVPSFFCVCITLYVIWMVVTPHPISFSLLCCNATCFNFSKRFNADSCGYLFLTVNVRFGIVRPIEYCAGIICQLDCNQLRTAVRSVAVLGLPPIPLRRLNYNG